MNAGKFKITTVSKILILIALMLTGYFIWGIFFESAGPKPEQVFIPPANNDIRTPSFKFRPVRTSEEPPLSYGKPVYKPADETAPLENPKNIPPKILPTSTIPFFENIYKAAKTAEIKVKNKITASTQATPDGIIISLTNDEFHFLYPDNFIASLIDAQNLFIKNYDPAYQPLQKIETDSQVRFVEEKIVAALLSINMLTKEEADRYINTIRFTLPQFQLVELKNRKSPALNIRGARRGLFLAGLVEKLHNVLIPKTQAAACGACYISPLCFQPGLSAPDPGINMWKPFCWCTGCYWAAGCLSFCTGVAAIWDPTTGLCGCAY